MLLSRSPGSGEEPTPAPWWVITLEKMYWRINQRTSAVLIMELSDPDNSHLHPVQPRQRMLIQPMILSHVLVGGLRRELRVVLG